MQELSAAKPRNIRLQRPKGGGGYEPLVHGRLTGSISKQKVSAQWRKRETILLVEYQYEVHVAVCEARGRCKMSMQPSPLE